MTTTEHDLPDVRGSANYWIGWLASAHATALRALRSTDSQGNPDVDLDHIANELEDAWQGFMTSHFTGGIMHLDDAMWAGFVLESPDGEAQAVRDTYAEAERARVDVDMYYDDARTCGHPSANRYVDKLYPMRVRQITKAERAELAEYPAVIDREP